MDSALMIKKCSPERCERKPPHNVILRPTTVFQATCEVGRKILYWLFSVDLAQLAFVLSVNTSSFGRIISWLKLLRSASG
jgi:hypothetical protein